MAIVDTFIENHVTARFQIFFFGPMCCSEVTRILTSSWRKTYSDQTPSNLINRVRISL